MELYSKYYRVLLDGTVISVRKDRPLIPQVDNKGYLYVTFTNAGKSKKFKVHRLVALGYLPNPDNKPEVNHKDGEILIMSKFIIYGRAKCKYCDLAKKLLKQHNIEFEYIDVGSDTTSRDWLLEQGVTKVPQIYKGDTLIGGYEDLQGYL